MGARRGEYGPHWANEQLKLAAQELHRRGVPRKRIAHFFCKSYSTLEGWLGPVRKARQG